MLQFIRSKVTSIFIKVLFAILIISFAIWGIGDIFLGNRGGNTAISVGNIEYSSSEVLSHFDRMRRAMRLPPEYDDALQPQILDNVIDSIVTSGLFESKSQNLKLTVNDVNLKEWIAEAPAFIDQTGQFNQEVFRRSLFNAGLSEEQFFIELSKDLKRHQITSSFKSAAPPLNILTKTLFRYRSERRTVEAIEIDPNSIQNLPSATHEELLQHYELNKTNYVAPEFRGGQTVILTKKEIAKEIMIPEEDLRTEYLDRQEEFTEPAHRNVTQFLFRSEASAKQAIAHAKNFKEAHQIENAFNAVTGKENIVLLDKLIAEDLSTDIERQLVFNTKVGRYSQPLKTPFGWKIFFIRSAKSAALKKYSEVSNLIHLELAIEKALDAVFQLANSLEDTLAGGATLEEAAKSINVKLVKIELVDATGYRKNGKLAAGITSTPLFLRTLFETPNGNQSQLIETDDGDYFLLRVDEIIDSHQQKFTAVSNEVRKSWRLNKRLSKARDIATNLSESSKSWGGLKKAAEAKNYSLIRIGPFDRFGQGIKNPRYLKHLPAVVFDIGKGDIGISESDTNVLVVKVIDIESVNFKNKRESYLTFKEDIATDLQKDYIEMFKNGLRKEYDISINRGYIDALFSENR